MAAYHWEARRRQIVLDRQWALQVIAAREKQKRDEAAGKQPCPDSQSAHPATVIIEELSMESKERKKGTTEEHCPCNTQHVPNHSGKLLKRYSDSEYVQQW